ncbi:MAG: PHP-associated domain-containing protein, partial [Spirochaetota bacterium]
IHSCLSPCGSLEMSPSAIVKRSIEAGLGCIAVTDHNTALNCPALKKVCERRGLACLFGMEITSTEEVHLLALFDDCNAAVDMGDFIYKSLPDIPNDPEAFGDQVYVDEEENILGELDKYLGAGAQLTIDEIGDAVHSRGGLFIPSHVDRPLYSMISQLGFLPDGNYDALEFSRHFMRRGEDIRKINTDDRYPVITNSDAHFLEGIGSAGICVDNDIISIKSLSSALRDGKVRPFF